MLVERFKAGERRADARAALVSSVIANVNRDPRRRPRPYKTEDFMQGKGAAGQTPAQQAAILQLIAARWKGGVPSLT